MFTSPPHSTHATLPDIIEEEGKASALVADLNRQIKDLQFQMTATNERNQHVEHELVDMRTTNRKLWSLSDKQSALIDALESKLNQAADIERDIKQLELERHDVEDTLQVVRDLALKQDKDTARALEEIAVLHQQQQQQLLQGNAQTSSNESSLNQQRTRALENRVEELDSYIDKLQRHHTNQEETERWRHTAQRQAAKIDALEKTIGSLKDELLAHQRALRKADTSGTIASLQDQIQQLQHEKMAVEEDFESSYEAVVNENDKITQLANQQSHQIQQLQTALSELHQQLGEQQNIRQAYDALSKEYELVEKMNQELVTVNKQIQHSSLASRQSTTSTNRKTRTPNRISMDDKPQLMSWVQEKLETSCTIDVLQKVSHLADENMQLAHWVDDLERQIMSQRHHLSQQVKTLECDVMNLTVLNNQLERQIETPVRLSRSSAATHSTHRIRRDETPPSVLSDYSVNKHRSTTPSVPPLTDPPNQPLPPTPPVSEQFDTQLRSYRIKLEMVENQAKAHQEQAQKLASDMENNQQEMQDQCKHIQRELDLERRQRQKAEQAHAILERRLQDVMNDKKNKFLCF